MKDELKNIVLLGKNIIIKPDLAVKDNVTANGIIVQNQGRSKTSKWGEVIKIGKDVTEVAVKDRILLWGITVGELELDGSDYMMAMSDKLLAIMPAK